MFRINEKMMFIGFFGCILILSSCGEDNKTTDETDAGSLNWTEDWSPDAKWGVEGDLAMKEDDDGTGDTQGSPSNASGGNDGDYDDGYYEDVDYDDEGEEDYEDWSDDGTHVSTESAAPTDQDSDTIGVTTDTGLVTTDTQAPQDSDTQVIDAGNTQDAGETPSDAGDILQDGGIFGDGDGGPQLAKQQKSLPQPKVLYLSADDSNSQSSPVLIRSLIQRGASSLPLDRLRIWEFFNYYSFNYAPPEGDAPLSVHQQLRPYDIEAGTYALQVGVQGRQISPEKRRPLNITLVLDTSGSMGGSPIELLKETCKAIASSLRAGDRISMVTWSTTQEIPIETLAVEGPNDPTLLSTINEIDSGGGTDLNAGLVRGYDLARQHFMPNGLNRVVLVSDGGANAGITDEEIIGEAAKGAEGEAIFLVGVGVGDDDYDDELMDTVTDWGKGASIYIDSSEEAYKMFSGPRFISNMEVTALDVRVEMTLPPFFDIDKFFGEEYSTVKSEVEPQHLAPNDAMIYQQLIKTTEPQSVNAKDLISLRVTFTDALTGLTSETSTSSTLQELVDGPFSQLRKGDAIVAYTQTLAFVEKAKGRDDIETAKTECTNGLTIVSNAAAELMDEDLEEIQSVLETYCQQIL